MTRPEPLPLARALNRQGVDGAYLLTQGSKIKHIEADLAVLKPTNVKLDEADRAPVSGDHYTRWRTQGWAHPDATTTPRSVWTLPGVAA